MSQTDTPIFYLIGAVTPYTDNPKGTIRIDTFQIHGISTERQVSILLDHLKPQTKIDRDIRTIQELIFVSEEEYSLAKKLLEQEERWVNSLDEYRELTRELLETIRNTTSECEPVHKELSRA